MGTNLPENPASGSPRHISGHLHVTGASRFIGEDNPPADLHQLKVLLSPHAHARILKLDTAAAAARPGVKAVLTWRDIPGPNQIGHPILDEPLLPEDRVTYAGQPVALVVARSAWEAEQAVAAIQVEYEPLAPVLTIADALARGELYVPERRIERGDLEAAFAHSAHVLEGVVANGSQEHFYMETQRCMAVPGEDREITLYSATQSTAEVQEVAARVLGLKAKDITVDVPRLGGAFGGKERTATLWACLAALACHRTGKPVWLQLTRTEDMIATGKRHPYESRYRVGFDPDGRIQAYEVELNANGGAYADLSIAILERAMLHADNAYYLPAARIVGRACRTNLPPNTAFRGFGAPQGIFVIERVMDRIAQHLGLDPLDVRLRHAYAEAQPTPYGQPVHEAVAGELLARLREQGGYARLRSENEAFNRAHHHLKRGLAMLPVKFGISFTSAFLNQASALVWVYSDGTISLSHGGIEMGQEVNTKVAQVVARELGVSLWRIRQETANTKRVANASPTAASTGSDLNGCAAQLAAWQIKERLREAAVGMLRPKLGVEPDPAQIIFAGDRIFDARFPENGVTFVELVHHAYMNRVDLGAHGYYATPGVFFDRQVGQGTPFFYFVFGCALVQVEVDLLSGQCRLLRVDILHETGLSLNPEIDRGQVAGAFIQGYGWSTFEEEVCNDRGQYLAISPSTYKIPTYKDQPEVFRIELLERPRRCASVYGSKAVGEPPLIYGEAAYFAIKDALASLAGAGQDVPLAMPATPEAVLRAVDQLK